MIYNFGAGPSVLPKEVLKKVQEELLDFEKSGMSVMEISHRSKAFQKVIDEAENDLRDLMSIPQNYKILFLQGGASSQFSMVPMNLAIGKKAYYNISGAFGEKAYDEAVKLSHFLDLMAVSLGSTKKDNYNHLLKIDKSKIDEKNGAYLHLTTNNTIEGTSIFPENLPEFATLPLVADMSSDILSRPVDVSKYGMIYGGAQKNIGPAGVTFVIVREDLLGKVSRPLPSMVDYRNHIANDSMFNTPPVFAIYVVKETLKWLKSIGGVKEIQKRNRAKAELLYDAIDNSTVFVGTAVKEDRSLMHVCFVMQEKYADLAPEFLEFAKGKGMVGIKGHRLVGGFRASIYNALPIESVQALVDCMREFEKMHVK